MIITLVAQEPHAKCLPAFLRQLSGKATIIFRPFLPCFARLRMKNEKLITPNYFEQKYLSHWFKSLIKLLSLNPLYRYHPPPFSQLAFIPVLLS